MVKINLKNSSTLSLDVFNINKNKIVYININVILF